MREAFFLVHEEVGPGSVKSVGYYSATGHTAGPWSTDLQHAGPASALLARAIGRLGGGPDVPHLARVAIEILAPVPVGPVRIEAGSLRPGRKVNLCEAALFADGSLDPLMRMSAWRLRQLPVPIDVPLPATEPPPGDGTAVDIPAGWSRGYLDAVGWQWVSGNFEAPGSATVWTELMVDLVEGETPTPTEHALAIADSASGISAVANPGELLFVNTDLTVHFGRPLSGDRIWMRAESRLDSRGIGISTSVLGDAGGAAAVGAQALFVEPRG